MPSSRRSISVERGGHGPTSSGRLGLTWTVARRRVSLIGGPPGRGGRNAPCAPGRTAGRRACASSADGAATCRRRRRTGVDALAEVLLGDPAGVDGLAGGCPAVIGVGWQDDELSRSLPPGVVNGAASPGRGSDRRVDVDRDLADVRVLAQREGGLRRRPCPARWRPSRRRRTACPARRCSGWPGRRPGRTAAGTAVEALALERRDDADCHAVVLGEDRVDLLVVRLGRSMIASMLACAFSVFQSSV